MASLYVPSSYVVPSELKKHLPGLRQLWRSREKEKLTLVCPNHKRCKRSCKTSQGMLRHYVKCGKDKFPFKCHFCPAKYGTHKTLKTHISTNHKDHLKQPGEKKSQVVWTPSDSEDLSSEEIDVGSDQNWLPDCGHATIQQAMLNGEEEGTSSSASGTQGGSDLYDMNESGQETSEGGGEESVRSGEGEVWRQGEVADPLVAEDLVTDTDSQRSDSTVTEVDIMSVSVDEEGGEVLKGGGLEGEAEEEIRDREEEDELFPDDWWSRGERWGRGSRWERNSSSDGEDVVNEQDSPGPSRRGLKTFPLLDSEEDNIESPQWEPLSDVEDQEVSETRSQPPAIETPILPVHRGHRRGKKRGGPVRLAMAGRRPGHRRMRLGDEDDWESGKEEVRVSSKRLRRKGRARIGGIVASKNSIVIHCEVLSGEEKKGGVSIYVPKVTVATELNSHRPHWKEAQLRGERVYCPDFEKCHHSCQTVKGMAHHFPKCRQLRTSWLCTCGRAFTARSTLVDHLRRTHGASVVSERPATASSAPTLVLTQRGSNKLTENKQERSSGELPVSPQSFEKQTSPAVSLSPSKAHVSSAASVPGSQYHTSASDSSPSVKTQTPLSLSPLSLNGQTKIGKARSNVPAAKIQHNGSESSKMQGGAESQEPVLQFSRSTLDYIPAAENAVCNDHDYTVIEGQHLNLQLTRRRMGGTPWLHCTMATTARKQDALATSGTFLTSGNFPASGSFPISRSAPIATIVLSKITLDEATREFIGMPSTDVRRDQPPHTLCSLSGGAAMNNMEALLSNDIHDIRFQYDVNRDIHCQYEVEVVAPDDYPYFVEMEKKKGDIFIMDDEHEVDDRLLEMTEVQADTFCHENGQVDGLNLIANLTYLQPIGSSSDWQVDGTKTSCCEDGTKTSCCEDGMKTCCCEDSTKTSCCEGGMKTSCCEDGTKTCCCEDGTKTCGNVALEAKFEQYRRRYAVDRGCTSVKSEFKQVVPGNAFSKCREKISHISLAKFGHVTVNGLQASAKTYGDISQFDGSGSRRKKTTPVKMPRQVENEGESVGTSPVAESAGMRETVTAVTAVCETMRDDEGDAPPCGSRVEEADSPSVVLKSPEERMTEHFQSCLDQGILLSARKTKGKGSLSRSGSTSEKVMASMSDTSQSLVPEGNGVEVGIAPKKNTKATKGKGKRQSSADKTTPSPKRRKNSEQAELNVDGTEEATRRHGIASSAQCIEQYSKDPVRDSGTEAVAQPQHSIAQPTTDEAGMGLDTESDVEPGSDREQGMSESPQSKRDRKGKARAKKGKSFAIPTTIPQDTPTPELRKIFNAMLRKHYVIRCTVPGCTYKAVNVAAMLYHFSRCGQEAKVYKCPQCDKAYTSTQGVKYHVATVHRNEEANAAEKKSRRRDKQGKYFDVVPVEKLEKRKAARKATLAVQQAIQDLDPQERATSITPRTPSGITMATTPLSTPTSAEPEPPSSSELPANMVEGMRLAMEQSVLAETPLPPGADFSPVIPQLTRACVEELKEGLRRSKKVKCPNEFCTQTLSSMTALKYHVPRCTPTWAKSQCTICLKRLKSIPRLRQHLRSKHPDAAVTLELDTEYFPGDERDDDDAEEGPARLPSRNEKTAPYTKCHKERVDNSWKEVCFPDWLPHHGDWRALPERRSHYISAREENPLKGVSCQVDQENVVELEGVSPHQAATVRKQELGTCGVIANTAGSILSFDWLPVPPGQMDHTHFIAVSTNSLSEGEDPHVLEEKFSCGGEVQLWELGGIDQVTEEGVADGRLSAQLQLCVSHEYGYIRSLKWCPSDSFVACGDGNKTLGRLGLLALACSDGAVRVLSVPHALPLVEAIGEMSRTPPFPVWVESVQTQAKLLPGAFGQSKERDIFGPCISVDWSRKDGHDKMAASFASGMIAVWHLLTESPLLKSHSSRGTKLCLYPVIQFFAHPCPCTSVQWCPHDSQWLMSGGHDCKLMVWNTHGSPVAPSLVLERGGVGIVRDIIWPPLWTGCLFVDDSVKSQLGCGFFLITHTDTPWVHSVLKSPAPFTSVSYCPWSSQLAGVTFGGAIELNCISPHLHKHSRQILVKQQTLVQLEVKPSHTPVNEEADELSKRKYTLNIQGPKCAGSLQSYCPFEHPVAAIMKVQWNPNEEAHKWLAAATRSGLLIILSTK